MYVSTHAASLIEKGKRSISAEQDDTMEKFLRCFRYAMICFSRTILLTLDHSHCLFKGYFQLLKQPWRSFSGLDTSPSKVVRNAEVQTIFTETLHIPKQGRLEVRCPFNLYVTPLNNKDFPRLDKAFFTIYGTLSISTRPRRFERLCLLF